MANHCYNWASIEGSKEMLDLFEKRLQEATKEQEHLWWETYFAVLGKEVVDGDAYADFGSRWFHVYYERHSSTTATISGDSAWSPVSEFFRQLSEVYQFEITSEYEEGGCDFGGWYNCKNGEVTKDETVSYQVYRLTEGGHEYFLTLLEDIEERCWESIDDIDEDLLAMLSEAQKLELILAFNKYKADETISN
jgi:hypothetical protein